jgi:hypothetical protein
VRDVAPLILESARKHQARDGFTDEDIWHAWNNVVGTVPGNNGMLLHLGPDRTGERLLEFGQVDCNDYPPPIVHAMLAQPKYVKALQKKGRR